ncbi:MAG TPA: cytochrome c [Gemmatimonadaceae bacterium]|nr:cytochrome c [Gemmatimonadaceae bacterium]
MKPSLILPLVGVCSIVVSAASLGPRAGSARTADPTFAEDVAPIVYRNCTSCHRPDGLAPFSLLDYESAAPKAGKIKSMVRSGQMPPWQAVGPRGVFRNDRRLTDEEKAIIIRWVDSGAKPGNLNQLPPRPIYSSGWEIGTPDAIVQMPDAFVVPASGTVEYQYFEVPTGITEDKWVQAIEIMPGSREVVHHVLVYARVPSPPGATPPTPASPRPTPLFVRNREHDVPDPPRSDSTPRRQLGALIGSTAPGTNVVEFPAGAALRLRAGTVLTFQMHYTPHGHQMKDRTSIGFKFAKERPDEEIFAAAFVNGSFTIPAGARDVAVPSGIGVTQPVKVWGLLPHTHLRGTRWLYKLERPDGTSETVLDVPRYDFNWQTYYLFKTPLEIPAGGKLTSMAWYDNSASNKDNPDPSVEVRWGDQTWEEMQYTGFLYSVPGRPPRPSP